MKYWKVSLLQDGRCARQWHVRAEVLTVGSHGSNKVRLPPPVGAFALQISRLSEALTSEVGPFTLVIEDETHQRNELWSVARTHVENAVSAASAAPREAPIPIRVAIATFTLLGLTNLAGSFLVDGRPKVLRDYERDHAVKTLMVRTGSPESAAGPSYQTPKSAGSMVTTTATLDFPPRLAPTAPLREAMRPVAVVGQIPTFPGSASGSSWEGGLLASGIGMSDPTAILAHWFASTPERYRAPWPDAPVPPH